MMLNYKLRRMGVMSSQTQGWILCDERPKVLFRNSMY